MNDPTRWAIIVARFYEDIADRLLAGARARLEEERIEAVDVFDVPGAFELPLAAKLAAQYGRYAGVICLGCVIRGETDHYEYVAGETARGILDASLQTGVPCTFGVLTVDSMEQALERVGGGERDTGRNAAEAGLALAALRAHVRR